MGEDFNIYNLDDFGFDILTCYIRHGFGNAKIWQTSFFTIGSDEMACMTLAQYYEKVVEARNEGCGEYAGSKNRMDGDAE